jgi:hypothetical protein
MCTCKVKCGKSEALGKSGARRSADAAPEVMGKSESEWVPAGSGYCHTYHVSSIRESHII